MFRQPTDHASDTHEIVFTGGEGVGSRDEVGEGMYCVVMCVCVGGGRGAGVGGRSCFLRLLSWAQNTCYLRGNSSILMFLRTLHLVTVSSVPFSFTPPLSSLINPRCSCQKCRSSVARTVFSFAKHFFCLCLHSPD